MKRRILYGEKSAFEKPKNDFPYEKSFVFAGIHFHILSTESLAIEDIEHYIPKEPDSHVGDMPSQIDIRFIIDPELEQSVRNACFQRVKRLQQKEVYLQTIEIRRSSIVCLA